MSLKNIVLKRNILQGIPQETSSSLKLFAIMQKKTA